MMHVLPEDDWSRSFSSSLLSSPSDDDDFDDDDSGGQPEGEDEEQRVGTTASHLAPHREAGDVAHFIHPVDRDSVSSERSPERALNPSSASLVDVDVEQLPSDSHEDEQEKDSQVTSVDRYFDTAHSSRIKSSTHP